ncbi:MAG: ABC-F type ribosomal protection protein [Firmicutes bacterium]|nr:ABC-F type ribosomal protection protein [Bacillota bacterium]
MSLINIQNLTFAYEGSYDNIFENVSFQIDTDWKLGLTGRNGRGKTTLMNLFQKKYKYGGTISASVDFEYFPYEIEDKSINTIDVLETICPNLIYWELVRELNKLKTNEDILYRPFYTLSNGEQTKVLLSAMFLKENSFMLIDEPTNHLDMKGRELIKKYLNSKKGFILISHDIDFLDGCIDHVLSINKTNIEIQHGSFSSYLSNKEKQDNFEISKNERLKKEIAKLQATAREKAQWSDRVEKSKIGNHVYDRGFVGHKSAKMMKRSKTIEARAQDRIEEKSKLLKNIESSEDLKIKQIDYHSSRLISLNNVSILYDENIICSNINFEINKGDRIALNGKNGSGKSSLIKLICGFNIPHSGDVEIGSRLKISYVPQDTSHLHGTLADYANQSGISETLFKTNLRKLDFARNNFENNIEDLSEGQKKKILIARSLSEEAHLYIWDEPINYIDVISRIQIEELLLKFKPTILFVEHDKLFSETIANKMIYL